MRRIASSITAALFAVGIAVSAPAIANAGTEQMYWTGGSLADITENVGQTVRARVEARKAIRSKTSLNRIESQIMVGLPVFMMAALLAISPSHREFYSQPSGWALIALAVVLDALAYLMMRKMGDVKLD